MVIIDGYTCARTNENYVPQDSIKRRNCHCKDITHQMVVDKIG